MRKKDIFFILMLLSVMMGVSCTSAYEEPTNLENRGVNTLEEYMHLGLWHNEMLDIADSIFGSHASRGADFSQLGVDSAIFAEIHEAYKKQVQKLEVAVAEKETYLTYLDECIGYYSTEYLYSTAFPHNTTAQMKWKFNALLKDGLIDSFEYELLCGLANAVLKNYQTNDNNALSMDVDKLCSQWEMYYGPMEQKAGVLSGQILAIAKSSADWWSEVDSGGSRALPAWVGCDIVGGLIGGISHGIVSYVGTGSVNWSHVGTGVVVGAVIGSTGIVRVAGNWLSNIHF